MFINTLVDGGGNFWASDIFFFLIPQTLLIFFLIPLLRWLSKLPSSIRFDQTCSTLTVYVSRINCFCLCAKHRQNLDNFLCAQCDIQFGPFICVCAKRQQILTFFVDPPFEYHFFFVILFSETFFSDHPLYLFKPPHPPWYLWTLP